MKTYEILLDCYQMDDYIVGCVTGLIYAITGVSDGAIYTDTAPVATMSFDATEEQVRSVVEWINKLYPDIYAGVKVAE